MRPAMRTRLWIAGALAVVAALVGLALLPSGGYIFSLPGGEPAPGASTSPQPGQYPPSARPISPGLAQARKAPLPRLVATYQRDGVWEAVMMQPGRSPRRYHVGDRLPGTDAEIVNIEEGRLDVQRGSLMIPVEVTPPTRPATEEEEPADDSDDLYRACTDLPEGELQECYEDVDTRLLELQASCTQFENDDAQWEACMAAADRLEPYPG